MFKSRLLLLFLLATPAALFAVEPRITLEQAVTTALERNPVRKAALLDRRAAAEGIKEARAALLPQLTLTESYLRGNDPVFVFGGKLRQQRFGAPDFGLNALNRPTPFGNFGTRLSGGWQVFDSGVNWNRMLQAKQRSTVAQRQLDRTEQQLIFRVIDSYMALLLAQKQAQVAEDAVKTSQAILDRSSARVDSGMAVESDLLSARVDRAARQQELIRARNGLQVSRTALNHEMGVPLETEYEPVEVLAERVLPDVSQTDAESRALSHRPEIAEANLGADIQRKSAAMAKSAIGPKVNVFASWEADNPHFAGGGGNNWTTGVEVQVDLFSGGAKLARVQHENLLADAAAARRDSLLSSVRMEARKAYFEFDSARQQVEVARAAVQESKESLRISQNRYEAGLSTITDILRVEEAALRAQTDYWQAVYRLQTSYANLELASGTLDTNSPVVKQ